LAKWNRSLAKEWRRKWRSNRSLAKWNRSLAKKWRRTWRTQSLFIGVLKGIPLYDIVGSSLRFFYSYLHTILIYSFSHIDLSFLAHLPFYARYKIALIF
jgi:hypothetical protein